jgi:hypothetical protein
MLPDYPARLEQGYPGPIGLKVHGLLSDQSFHNKVTVERVGLRK